MESAALGSGSPLNFWKAYSRNVVAGEGFDVLPLSDEDSALATMRSIIGPTLFAFCSLMSNAARQDLLVVRGED